MKPSPYRGYHVGLEVVSGVLVGTVLGYFVDFFLGSSPFWLIIFIVLGAIAGFRNMIKSARSLINLTSQREKDD
jgi:ATP synthase protein I